jgi:hypothetical protein
VVQHVAHAPSAPPRSRPTTRRPRRIAR